MKDKAKISIYMNQVFLLCASKGSSSELFQFSHNGIIYFGHPLDRKVLVQIRKDDLPISILRWRGYYYFEALFSSQTLLFFAKSAKETTSLFSIASKDSTARASISARTSSSSTCANVSCRLTRIRRSIRLSFFADNSITQIYRFLLH